MAAVPSGTITFLFTEIEGSTRLWEEQPDAMRQAIGSSSGRAELGPEPFDRAWAKGQAASVDQAGALALEGLERLD